MTHILVNATTPPRHSHDTDTTRDTIKSDTDNNISCEYCRTSFTRLSSLARHKKLCSNKKDKEEYLEEKIKLLNIKLVQYEKDAKHKDIETKHYKKETGHYKEEVVYYKQMLREAGGLVKKSVNALTYAMDNYEDASALKTITIREIDTFEDPVKKIVEDILSSYKHKTLGKYLGDFILKIHKKDDPKDQSIWNKIEI